MKVLKSKWFLSLMILSVGWLMLSFIKIKLHENLVNKEVSELENKILTIEKSNTALEKFISFMSDPAFLEKQARIKLNYKSPDEEVVFIYPDNLTQAGSSSYELSLSKAPNIVKWWNYLLDF